MKNHIYEVFDLDPAGDATEGAHCQPQFLGLQFRQLGTLATQQRVTAVFQRPSVAQAGDRGGVLATTKGLPGPLDQPRQQRLQSLAGLDRKRERPAVLQFLAEPIYRRRLAAVDLVQQQDSAGIEDRKSKRLNS